MAQDVLCFPTHHLSSSAQCSLKVMDLAAALAAKKAQLRPVQENDPRMGEQKQQEKSVFALDELSQEEKDRIRKDFFAAGAEHWLPLLGDYSFATTSIPLSREMCVALSKKLQGTLDSDREALEQKIDDVLKGQGWKQAFVKLSVRSPKDSPQILAKATEEFRARNLLEKPLQERTREFAELVQQQFAVSSGREAVGLLTSSDRIVEDLEYALEAPCFDELGPAIICRRWDGALPIASEFRGTVWNGQLNCLSQYYHPLTFPDMLDKREDVARDLLAVWKELRPGIVAAGFTHCIIDFAWLGPQQVKVIELNPFDGITLGCFPGSTGLFLWDNENDRKIMKEGPFEIRMRTEPLSEYELKLKLNVSWREIVAPPGSAGPRRGGGSGGYGESS